MRLGRLGRERARPRRSTRRRAPRPRAPARPRPPAGSVGPTPVSAMPARLTVPFVERDVNGDADGGEVAHLALELVVRPARDRAGIGDVDLRDDLRRLERRRERALEELVERDRARAARAARLAPSPRRPAAPSPSRPAGRRGRASRPRCRGCARSDRRSAARRRRACGSLPLRTLDRSQALWRTSAPIAEPAVLLLELVEAIDPVDVDQRLGSREPQLHQRDQALAAGDHLRLVAEARREPQAPRRASLVRSTRSCLGTSGSSLLTSPVVPGGRTKRHNTLLLPAPTFPYDPGMAFGSVDEVERALAEQSYLPDRGLATAIYLALAMRRPLLLEGEAGVGKTEVGKTLARILDAELIRLQCYEGIDASQALYEWDYSRQLLYARALQAGEIDAGAARGRAVRARVPARAAAAARDPRRCGRRAAHRRARPRGRRVRGVPARGPRRLTPSRSRSSARWRPPSRPSS